MSLLYILVYSYSYSLGYIIVIYGYWGIIVVWSGLSPIGGLTYCKVWWSSVKCIMCLKLFNYLTDIFPVLASLLLSGVGWGHLNFTILKEIQ